MTEEEREGLLTLLTPFPGLTEELRSLRPGPEGRYRLLTSSVCGAMLAEILSRRKAIGHFEAVYEPHAGDIGVIPWKVSTGARKLS